MPYQTGKPQPNDDLDVSVTDIQQNFLIANTVMDVDHYPFNDVTANKGFHNQVTSPDQGSAPAATVNAQLFGLQQTANLGTLQYSKRSITAYDATPIPSPVTKIQSKGATVTLMYNVPQPIFDFSGTSLAICSLKILAYTTIGPENSTSLDLYWNGTSLKVILLSNTLGPFDFPVAGSVVSINYILNSPASTKVVWTLIPHRLQ